MISSPCCYLELVTFGDSNKIENIPLPFPNTLKNSSHLQTTVLIALSNAPHAEIPMLCVRKRQAAKA